MGEGVPGNGVDEVVDTSPGHALEEGDTGGKLRDLVVGKAPVDNTYVSVHMRGGDETQQRRSCFLPEGDGYRLPKTEDGTLLPGEDLPLETCVVFQLL